MSDIIKIMIFALASFIIGHTATEKLSDNQVASIAVDSLDNIYRLELIKEEKLEKLEDSLVLQTGGFRNPFFISKSDSNDNLIWVRNVGGSPFELPNKIYTGPDNSLYLLGSIGSQFSFNQSESTGIDNTMTSTAFLVKFSPEGEELWASFVPGLDLYRYYDFYHVNGQPVIEGFYNGMYRKQNIWPNSDIYWRD